MALSPTMSHAADLTNSSGSNYTDGVEGYVDVGEDTTQGKVSSKVSIDDVTDTTYADTSETEVYATKNSIFSVIIPKVITLDGSTKSGDYQVAVKGDLSGSQEISVTPDENVTLHEQNAGVNPKTDVVAGIVQGKTVWNQSEIVADVYDGTGTTKGTITANGITAGSWSGNFNFDIELDNKVEKEMVILADTGQEINAKLKQLVSSSATYYNTSDTTITNIEKTNVPPSADAKQVALSTEEEGLSTLAVTDDVIAYLDGTVVKIYTNAKKIVLPEDCSFIFYNFRKLTSLGITKNFDTSNVTNMYSMFSDCKNLESLNLSNFDTSNVTNMGSIFQNCSKLTSLDLSNFDTSKVTSMHGMFYACSGLISLDLNNFDTGNVTSMYSMFSDCKNLESLNLSNFDTSKVEDMSFVFSCCTGLTLLDVSNFDTSKVTKMTGMFEMCQKLTSLDVSNLDTSKVTDMNNIFNGCSGLTSLDVSNFDTSNVKDMGYMFSGCSKLTSLDLSSFNMRNITNMSGMFNGCSVLEYISFAYDADFSNVSDYSWFIMWCPSTISTNNETVNSWIIEELSNNI